MNDRKINRPGLLVVAVSALVFSGCATAPRTGQSVTIQTGRVVASQPVTLPSRAPSGAAIGGVVGYVTTSSRHSSSRRARNAILGAMAGSAIAGVTQGSLSGVEYTVETASGGLIRVTTDQTEIRIGDCVNVEQAGSGTANVRRVSAALCEAAARNAVDADIRAEMTDSADRCLAAKDSLVQAESEAQIEAAIRRVKILCDD